MGEANRLVIDFPWPQSSKLSQNSRGHWAKKAKSIKAYRTECAWIARAAGIGSATPRRMHVAFYPPDRRKRDDDNMTGSFKAGRDGIADAIGCDDSVIEFEYSFHRNECIGVVRVTVG